MRGPGRYKKTLKRSKTLRNLRPGIYRIIAKPTKSKKFKATASVRTQRIRVTASGARALVNYDSIVSRKLTRLPSSGIRAFAPPALGGVGTLRTNKNFARGDIIAGGVSPKAPHGLLVRVVSKSGQTYRVQQVPLDQAIPRGRFAVRFNTNLAPAARALRHGRVGARAIQKMPVKCQAAVAAGIEVGASGGISTNISADWDWAESWIIDSGGPLGTPNPGSEIAGDVAGPGVAITSPDSGGTAGTGRVPSFDGQGDAWVLSTGLIAQVTGTDSSFFASSDRGEPGNATLSSLAGEETQDATFVNMTVTPSGNRLRIDYMFGSEEYPEYVGSSYNDVMGVFVNGQNCATVPGTSSPVAVNTVNGGTNSAYFVDNGDGHIPTTLDGVTTRMSCVVPVTPGQPVAVLIGVADSSDGIYDSAVALVDGGVSSFNE